MAEPLPRQFAIPSADGMMLHGEVDLPDKPNGVVVLMVPGTGVQSRDEPFGRSGTPRDKVFKDLAVRITARGGAVVRYDPRGVDTSANPPKVDRAVLATLTTTVMTQDLGAIYAWMRSRNGLGAHCVVVFGHSEGTVQLGRLASFGAPAPDLLIGMGAGIGTPIADVLWQETERDVFSLKMMDTDHDGTTTNDEVAANWRHTPAARGGNPARLLYPNGRWTQVDLDRVRARATAYYEKEKRDALAMPDDAPYPNAATAFASGQWWKSWFLDDTPVAKRLSVWKTRFILHYGTWDSQTNPSIEVPAAKAFLPADRLTVELHPGGHSLGEDPLFGPVDEVVADNIADEAAAACNG